MEASPSNLLHLIRLCAVRKDRDRAPWEKLLAEIDDLVRSGLYAHGAANDLLEVKEWFPGWLFITDKLSAVEAAFQKKVDAGELRGSEQSAQFVRNYLARVVQSGVAEFYRELRRGEHVQVPEVLRLASEERPERVSDDRMQRVAEELLKLAMTLRVPFRLRHYAVLGPLHDDELQFIEEQSGLPRAKAAEIIEAEFRRNESRDFPLSSAFIGQLIGITDDDPKSNTVNRRIMRARLRLIEKLRGER